MDRARMPRTAWTLTFLCCAALTCAATTGAETVQPLVPSPAPESAGPIIPMTASPSGFAMSAPPADGAWACDCFLSRSGFVASVEWLNWQARRQGLDFATFVDPVWLTPVAVESLTFDRDNGVRVGLGYRFESAWDVTWNYTYFRTGGRGAVDQTQNPGLSLIATQSFFDVTVDSVTAEADLTYNVHDLEVGRRLIVNDTTAVRLFGGFRWAMIDQSGDQQYVYPDGLGGSLTGTIHERTETDAYGIRLGAETEWTTRWGIGLFGRVAGSVLVANVCAQRQEVDEDAGTILDFTDKHSQAMPVFDAAAGVSWTGGRWQLAGGYELASWFNVGENDRASQDLILDGFFLRAGLGW